MRPDRAPLWGAMSAHQMVCHVADALRMGLGLKTVGDASTPWSRTAVKWIALYLPLPWPAGTATRPEIDQKGGGTRPVGFDADVAAVETLLEEFATAPPGLDGRAHPVFGRLSDRAWLRWGYRHMDHHLRQFGA